MLAITENPIEDGSVIADHAVLEPKEITIMGVVVDYDPKDGRPPSTSNSRSKISDITPLL